MNGHVVTSYAIGLITVGLALAVFYAIARAWKTGRFNAASQKRLISVVETAALSQSVVLQVVRVGTRHYALATGSATVTLLCELEIRELTDV